MTTFFLIHGIEGSPNENWFPWLKTELERDGHTVIIPAFPSPGTPNLQEWIKEFEQYELDEHSIIIGHSLGVAFLLTVLETQKAKAAFLIAPVSSPLENEFDEKMTTFSHKEFNWENIKNNCKTFHIFHSDNDPYVPLEKAQNLASNLNVELTLIKNAGHFNATAGYMTFELLLKKIKKLQ